MASSHKHEDMQGMLRKSSGGWISFITHSTYKGICEKYDDFLDRHDHVNVILKFPPRRVCNDPLLRKDSHTRYVDLVP